MCCLYVGLPMGHCPFKLHAFHGKEGVQESVINPIFDLQVNIYI